MKTKKLVKKLKNERSYLKEDIDRLKVKREAGVLQQYEFEDLQYNLELRDALEVVISYYSVPV